MGRLLTLTALVIALLPAVASATQEFDATIDLRGVASDGERSYLNGGLGELRFDSQHDGARVGELRFGYRADVDQIVHFIVEAVSYGDHERYPLDLTQAYVELRPFPVHAWRSRVKLGAFYAPVSLENWLTGWRTPYTISPSAINSWVGEELRTLGAEYDLDWLGRQWGHDWDLGLTAAAYGWNEPAGTLLARRGWSINDLQSTLFGRIGEPGNGPIDGIREFAQIDHRFGYYAGGSATYRGNLQLRALHYDNRADPGAYSRSLSDYAWRTSFDSAGVAWTPASGWTLISQWLGGQTCTATDPYCWDFHAAFLLGSWQRGADRFSVRYDLFETNKTSTEDFYSFNNGHAWTLAYQHAFSARWSTALELLQIDSRLLARTSLGEPVGARERELQVAVRCEL
ncbi:MAG: hypothetical protein ACREU2_16560 [Steroidobacteraceae bacterium]